MAKMPKKLDARKIMANMTMTLTLKKVKELKFRIWVGTKLIMLAARIMGMGTLEVNAEEE